MAKESVGSAKGTTSAAETIVRDILRGLYEGRYVSGQRLVEPDLIGRYGVSRSTVREAIKRLAAQGVVETRHHHGARIMTMTRDEALNILLIAEVLVGLAARQAAEHIDEGTARQDLQDALDAVTAAALSEERFDFILSRNHFHRTLARIARSRVLEQSLFNLHVHLVRNKLVMTPEQRAASYQRIADAIFAGDAAAAEVSARAHVRAMIDLLRSS
ncbi:GntR family transcriptional regulator [Antarcticimicrobium luteum]|uniref:GntR family transcriptional regulator n=1 Tax=Antarcticimicrobium luteum TaxID=2547397 RepID=A0A4R5V1U4_9RHOB|nr:GntR family transcriptional regulator [Antarcticimicrobium luteum]TDK45719.1 GntR family transcriptional regulator [Antarcticimicrobium luteum]